jgi:hypothetical protein
VPVITTKSSGRKKEVIFFMLGNFSSLFILKASLSLCSLIKQNSSDYSTKRNTDLSKSPSTLSFNTGCAISEKWCQQQMLAGLGWSWF